MVFIDSRVLSLEIVMMRRYHDPVDNIIDSKEKKERKEQIDHAIVNEIILPDMWKTAEIIGSWILPRIRHHYLTRKYKINISRVYNAISKHI